MENQITLQMPYPDVAKEAYEAVCKINNELYKKYSKKDWSFVPELSITLTKGGFIINLHLPYWQDKSIMPEFQIYSTYDDEKRMYFEKSEKFESFYKFIKREFLRIKEDLCSWKL